MKKLFSLALVLVMLFSCAAISASADSDAYLGVMLSTNVMSLDTNLATDGDPFLRDTLSASEEALAAQLATDPLCIRTYLATKGQMAGNLSFDDRAYVRFQVTR